MMVMDSGSNGGEVEKAHTHTHRHTLPSVFGLTTALFYSQMYCRFTVLYSIYHVANIVKVKRHYYQCIGL